MFERARFRCLRLHPGRGIRRHSLRERDVQSAPRFRGVVPLRSRFYGTAAPTTWPKACVVSAFKLYLYISVLRLVTMARDVVVTLRSTSAGP